MRARTTGLTGSGSGNRLRSGLPGDQAAAPIAEGDAARDRRDWQSAADHYRLAVSIDPSLAAIWVQLGHALKESGDLTGGETAYRRAWSLEPDTADSALQLGHVLKLQDKRPEAIEWYKVAMVLDRRHDDPVRELLALGVSRAELNATLAERLPDPSPPAAIRSMRAIFWDVNTEGMDGIDGCWRRGLIRATGWPGATPPGGGIRLLLDPRPDDPFDFARRLQSDALDRTPLLVLPLVMPLRHPAWFSSEAVADCGTRLRALLPVVAGIWVADTEDSTLLGGFCQANGITPPPITVLAFPPGRSAEGGTKSVSQARSAWGVLLPRDPVEQLQLLVAWRRVADRPKTLILMAPPALSTMVQATLSAGFPDTEVSLMPASPEIGAPLAGLDHLLVPASREDSDPWIAAALAAGVSVKAAAAPSVFARWGSAVGAYIDWRDADVLARRWAGPVPTGTSGDAIFAGWGTALKSAVRAMPVPPVASLPAIGIGTFYFLGDTTNSPAANGKPAQFGTGWGETLAEGAALAVTRESATERRRDPHPVPPHKGGGRAAIFSLPLVGRGGVGVDEPLNDLKPAPTALGPGSAMLRFRLGDLLGRSFRCRVLLRNIGTAPDYLDVTLGADEIRKVQVPAGRWRWIDWQIANPAVGSRFGDVSIALLASGSAGARLVVVGFFIFPEDADHIWFEFMDEVSRCRYRFLHRITI